MARIGGALGGRWTADGVCMSYALTSCLRLSRSGQKTLAAALTNRALCSGVRGSSKSRLFATDSSVSVASLRRRAQSGWEVAGRFVVGNILQY